MFRAGAHGTSCGFDNNLSQKRTLFKLGSSQRELCLFKMGSRVKQRLSQTSIPAPRNTKTSIFYCSLQLTWGPVKKARLVTFKYFKYLNKDLTNFFLLFFTGFGSFGTVLQGPIVGAIAENYGWHGMLYTMVALSIAGGAAAFKGTYAKKRTLPRILDM